MSRLLNTALSFCGGLLLSASVVSAQVIGGPPQNNPSGIRVQQQAVAAQPNVPPGLSAEEILRLIFPPETVYPNDPPRRARPAIRPENQPRQRVVPSSQSVSQMTMLEQRSLLRQSLTQLDEELTKLPKGSDWKDYLQIEHLGHSLWCQKFPDTDLASREDLTEILQRVNLVKQNSKYTKISNLWGFQIAEVVLPWYAQSAVEKQQHQLSVHASSLNQSLSRLKTGPSWKRHLRADEVMRLATQDEELSQSEETLLREIHQRYQQVEQDEQYRVIALKPGFSKTNSTLCQLVEAIKKERQKANLKKALESIVASKKGSPLERNVAVALQKIKALRMACADENEAKWQAAMSSEILQLADADERETLDRKSSEAHEILRLAKDDHTQAVDSAEENLRRILMMIKNAKQEEREGETVMVMPLEDPEEEILYELLPFEDNEPEPAETEILPLED
ncbi:MAG: hypothetical protein ACKVH8_18955 [Pirellulales bacterium]